MIRSHGQNRLCLDANYTLSGTFKTKEIKSCWVAWSSFVKVQFACQCLFIQYHVTRSCNQGLLQYCAKVMQVKWANFFLSLGKFSSKNRVKIREKVRRISSDNLLNNRGNFVTFSAAKRKFAINNVLSLVGKQNFTTDFRAEVRQRIKQS